MRRNGYKTAEIVERTPTRMPQKFRCACSRLHVLSTYVFAHFHETLFHTCDCGRKNIIKSGVVQTPIKAPKK
jgi:transcription elongation factor Elf1